MVCMNDIFLFWYVFLLGTGISDNMIWIVVFKTALANAFQIKDFLIVHWCDTSHFIFFFKQSSSAAGCMMFFEIFLGTRFFHFRTDSSEFFIWMQFLRRSLFTRKEELDSDVFECSKWPTRTFSWLFKAYQEHLRKYWSDKNKI